MLDHDFSLVFGTDPYSGGTPQPSGAAGTRIEHETKDSEEHAARLHAEDMAAVKPSSISTSKTHSPGLTSTF